MAVSLRLRLFPAYLLLGMFCLFSSAAIAGTVSHAETTITWNSTTCTAPEKPASIFDENAETPALRMNERAKAFNDYIQAAETYMQCLSNEAARDASDYSQSITQAAEEQITTLKNDIEAASLRLQTR